MSIAVNTFAEKRRSAFDAQKIDIAAFIRLSGGGNIKFL
jgi:hypothetical protein